MRHATTSADDGPVMTGPSHHAAILAGLTAAWAADDAGDYPAGVEIIASLHLTYGTAEVLSVAAALDHHSAPTGGSHA